MISSFAFPPRSLSIRFLCLIDVLRESWVFCTVVDVYSGGMLFWGRLGVVLGAPLWPFGGVEGAFWFVMGDAFCSLWGLGFFSSPIRTSPFLFGGDLRFHRFF